MIQRHTLITLVFVGLSTSVVHARPPGPPPEAIEACEGRTEGDVCEVNTPHGRLEGTCRIVPEELFACVPNGHRPPPGAPDER